MKKLMLIAVLGLLVLSCRNEEKKSLPVIEEQVQSTKGLYTDYFNDTKKVRALSDKILFAGDTLAYRELYSIYALSGHKEEYLCTSILMANKYGYKQACYDVYSILHRMSNFVNKKKKMNKEKLTPLDNETQVFALKYLKKAAKQGHVQAKEDLLLYGKNGELLLKYK